MLDVVGIMELVEFRKQNWPDRYMLLNLAIQQSFEHASPHFIHAVLVAAYFVNISKSRAFLNPWLGMKSMFEIAVPEMPIVVEKVDWIGALLQQKHTLRLMKLCSSEHDTT